MRSAIPFRNTALALACGSLFAAGAALAQDAQQNPPPTSGDSTSSRAPASKDFKQLDSNADGYVDKDEAVADAAVTRDFARRDIDGDGKLSETEFAAAPPASPPAGDASGSKQP